MNRRALLLACGLLIIQQLCAINTVMYYVPYILQLSGAENVAAWSLLPAGTNAVGTLVAVVLVDRIGRRLLLLTSIAAVIVSLVVFAIVVVYAKWLTVWALVLYLMSFSPGLLLTDILVSIFHITHTRQRSFSCVFHLSNLEDLGLCLGRCLPKSFV